MLYLISFPIFLVLLVLLIIIIKTYSCVEFFKSTHLGIEDTKHFNDYIISIDSAMYDNKVGVNLYNQGRFRDKYLSMLYPVHKRYNYMLKEYIQKSKKLTKNIPVFNKYKWNFLCSKHGLELNMPYTIHDYIVIPENMLESIYKRYITRKEICKRFLNTFIHERLHIVQRFNQAKFNKYYRERYSFFKGFYKKQIPKEIRSKQMSNPDSNNSISIYKLDNQLYYTLLRHHNGNLDSIAINIKNGDIIDLDYIKKQLGYDDDISFYHPNEIFACEVAKKIENRKYNNRDIKFLKSL